MKSFRTMVVGYSVCCEDGDGWKTEGEKVKTEGVSEVAKVERKYNNNKQRRVSETF